VSSCVNRFEIFILILAQVLTIMSNLVTDSVDPLATAELPVNRDLEKDLEECLRRGCDSLSPEYRVELETLVRRHPTVCEKSIGCCNLESMKIDTGDASPIASRPFRQNPLLAKEMKTQVEELLKLGLVRRSDSPWTSSAWMIGKPKSPGEYRMVIDYRKLNKVTLADKTRPPRIDETLDELAGARVFTALDLRSG
ncbi:hypothetical protein FOL47_005265, partial [Perkinsus chesapeaki]